MNGDAAEALAVAKGKAAQAAKVVTPVTPDAPAAAPIMPAGLELSDIVLDPEPEQPADVQLESKKGSSDIEFFDGTMDFSSVAGTAPPDGIEIHEDIVLQPREIEVEGLARTQYEASGIFKTDADRENDDSGTVDLPLIMPEPEDEIGAPEETSTDIAPTFSPPPQPDPESAAAPGRRTPTSASGPPAAVTLSDDDGAADTAALSRVEPVLTETMAELYLKQGHQEEALRVYQALHAQRPGDARLRAKVDALSGGGAPDEQRESGAAPRGQSVQAFLKGILGSRPGKGAAVPSQSEPIGSSPLDSAFATLGPDPEPLGRPTRAAADDLSLDEVFGDEAPSATAAAATAPRMEQPAGATVPAPPTPVPPPAGGFSFDEFFNTGGAPEAGGSPAPNLAPRPSGSRSKPPLEDEGDLDQFQSWLKGLKT